MDFLAAWQEGIQNVIATSGTSLAETQLRQLRRICDTIILGFDMDAAGETATERGVLLAAFQGFTVKILTLPKGKDIADFVRSSPGEITKLVANPKHLMEYYFENLQRKFSLESVEGKTRAAAYALSRLKTLASSSERSLWIRELAAITGIREDALLEDLARVPSLLEGTAFIPGENNDSSAGSTPRKTRKEMLAERALAFALGASAKPPFAVEFVAYFPPGRLADLAYQLALNAAIDSDSDMIKYLGMRLDYEYNLKPDLNPPEELQLSLKALKELALKEKRVELSSALVRAESDNNETEKLKLIDEISKLNQELRSI
jgi:DNA primase